MKALDTNVLVRLLLADDPKQLEQVQALLSQKQMFTAPVSVMLELVWVLEGRDFDAVQIGAAVDHLLALPNFKPDHLAELRQALTWYSKGMDFADAVHLALSAQAKQLLTFDKAFIKIAKREGLSEAGVPWVAEVA
jgi:predicted nucleic-acid-binding protein